MTDGLFSVESKNGKLQVTDVTDVTDVTAKELQSLTNTIAQPILVEGFTHQITPPTCSLAK